LSLAQLARRARTPTSAVARIEAADFTRQSIAVLTRVAGALGLRLEIRCVEVRRKTRGA
jgi:transcriptional regulator with XRE-family HTH domain